MFETLLLAGGTFWVGLQAYQVLKQKVVLFAGKSTNPHAPEPPLSSAVPSIQREQQKMVAATASLVLATAGALLYPPLSLAALPTLLYLTMPAIRQSYTALVHEQRVSYALVNITIPALCLLNGYYTALSLNFLVTSGGSYLLATKREQTQQKLRQMFSQLPQTIQIDCNRIEVEIPLTAVKPGDTVIVSAGHLIPVDGTVVQGVALVTERALTPTAQPVQKAVGDAAFASTLVAVGKLWIRAEKVATETAAAQIHALIHTTAQQGDDSLADEMALPMLGLGALTAFLLNPMSAIALLHARLGYDLAAVQPVGRLNFLYAMLKEGVLVKDPAALSVLYRVDTVVMSYHASRQPGTGAGLQALRANGIAFIYIIGAPAALSQTQVAALAVDDIFYEDAAHKPDAVIAQLQATGKCVCYVGDGLADAAAMRQADVGVSLHGVADLAANAAPIVLLTPDLQRLSHLLRAAAAFQKQVETTFALTYAPGLLTLAGVVFLHTGIVSAILVNQIGLILGLHQMMQPLPTKCLHSNQSTAPTAAQLGFA